jgi:tRNA threonylcarbamoyladenosine dehydratase
MENWQERTGVLIGEEGLNKLKNATVLVVGLGGVGAYAAEMLCRSGVGKMILLDSDTVNETNKNRQLIALDSTIGKLKCEVLGARLKDINPNIQLRLIAQYVEQENLSAIFADAAIRGTEEWKIDYVVDAIDTLSPKISLIKYCVTNSIPHVSSMGAGAKLDATKIRIADLSKSYNCPLAFILRKKLRKEGISKGFQVVFSEELPDRDAIVPAEERNKKSQVGTISYLPAVFGCVCAQAAVCYLLDKEKDCI